MNATLKVAMVWTKSILNLMRLAVVDARYVHHLITFQIFRDQNVLEKRQWHVHVLIEKTNMHTIASVAQLDLSKALLIQRYV
jgi:hypothetical protein